MEDRRCGRDDDLSAADSIVYAPVVDSQKKNQASAATSKTSRNTTTVSFTTQNSKTVPIDSQFHTVSDIAKGMTALGGVLKLFKDPVVNGIGAGLSTIAGLLGSSAATQNDTSSVTS